jgi:hypothetical protein
MIDSDKNSKIPGVLQSTAFKCIEKGRLKYVNISA